MVKRTKKAVISIITILTMLAVFLPARAAVDELSYQFGTATLYSTFTSGQTLTDSFYYTDDWFFEDPGVRNDSLALLSMQLTAAAVDGEGGCGIDLLTDLGFDESGFYSLGSEDPDSCSYAWGRKEISSGEENYTLVAVAIQSYAFDKPSKKIGWTQNFRVNADTPTEEHFAFQTAVNSVIDSVAALSGSGNVKYWIMGQSRGGALANLLAAELPQKLSAANGSIYAYTFEAPAVINSGAASVNERDFSYIHNYLCSDDIVTMIPPWGMVRYGMDFTLNIPEVDEKMPEELGKLGSDAYSILEDYSGSTAESTAISLMNTLTAAIPSREDYTAGRTDSFITDDGSEITISYVYQDLFMKLMGIIFGDEMGEIDTSAVGDHLIDLVPAIRVLVKAVSENSDSSYYGAAKELSSFLTLVNISLPLSDEDLYALLKLVGPWMVDLSYAPDVDSVPDEECLGFVTPLISLFGSINGFTFSHHFDTLVARLKALAPAPMISGLDITIPGPAAGDASSAAPLAVADFVESLENDWVSVEANWEGTDDPLPTGKVSYLDITLSVTGAGVPEDFALTLNGAAPVEPVRIVYENGIHRISGVWEFTFGDPETITVTFDTASHMAAPEPVTVKAGQQLKYAISPETYGVVTDQDKLWQFNGWFNGEGSSWDTLFAENDITLYAKWIWLIDTVKTTVTIPHVGESFTAPTVPEGCGYYVDDVEFFTENWEQATEAADGIVYFVSFTLYCESDDIRFLQETDESEFCSYLGSLFINEEEQEFDTYEDHATGLNCEEGGRYLGITYYFEPLPAEEPPAPHTHELSLVEAEKETCVKDGRIAYYICSGCGKLFEDPSAQKELKEQEIVIKATGHSWGEWITTKEPTESETGTAERTCTKCGEKETKELEKVAPAPAIEYQVVSGANAVWTKGSTDPVTLTIKRNLNDETCFSHFNGIQVDGTILAPENYEAVSGSTVITINSAYLETLNVGSHAVLVSFDDGKAESGLTVNAAGSATITPDKTSPDTGDPNHPELWLGILIAAAVLLFYGTKYGRKQK